MWEWPFKKSPPSPTGQPVDRPSVSTLIMHVYTTLYSDFVYYVWKTGDTGNTSGATYV